MNRHSFLLLIGILILLSGCTLSPKYTRPEDPITAGWPTGAAYQEIKTTTGTPTASELRWQEFFIGEKLQRIIEMALNNKRDLRLAALEKT
ncbi:MAG: hypothetical protein ABIG67_04355 [Pseudomonadota bacterium]